MASRYPTAINTRFGRIVEKNIPESPVHNILLSKAFRRFQTELDGFDVNEKTIPNVINVDALLEEAKILDGSARQKGTNSSLKRLEPILSQINNFAAIIAVFTGADAKATGLVWGSIKLILKFAHGTGDTLPKIIDMLDEMSSSLPRFRIYEETVPMNEGLESALVDVYAEMMCFCARTIKFFRSNGMHSQLIRHSWKGLSSDFDQTIKRLKDLSKRVDVAAETARFRNDAKRNEELIAAMSTFKVTETKTQVLPCYVIPQGVNEQFYGRDEVLSNMSQKLDPDNSSTGRRCVIHGMGGVGKTRLAMQYLNRCRDLYDAIFWVSADTPIKMTQSFLTISRRLSLTPENDEAQDSIAAISKVKLWLEQTQCKWLLVFDNIDSVDVVQDAFPATTAGSILLTARDATAGFDLDAEAIQLLPFDNKEGTSAFLSLVKRDTKSPTDLAAAGKIVEELGGLPLALSQIGGLIVQQRLALKDFLPMYERNSAKIDQKRYVKGSYEHTLSTVWKLSLEHLSGSSAALQNLLAFLDPDKVHESILLEGGKEVDDDDFQFLKDDLDFLDAKEPLLKAALIDRFYQDDTLSLHRLVQAAVLRRLSDVERVKYFDVAITLLSNSFPNSWNTVTSHQFSAWGKCELCLPHVSFLIKQSKKHKIIPKDGKAYAELIFRTAWYLYEREQYDQAREFVKAGLDSLDTKNELMYASALMLSGLIDLDTNQMQAALNAFDSSLNIRSKILHPDDAFIASSLNAIAIAQTELGNIKEALEAGNKAIDIRLRTKSDRIGNSYSNMASTLMRMGKPEEAEEMLMRCPSLKDFSDETFLKTGNPRFSGDMVLLAKIRKSQGRLDDALRLSSKALTFRQDMLGNGLKTCDSSYQVASLLQLRGDLVTACQFLEQSITISERLSYGHGYTARSKYKLAQIYKDLGFIQQGDSTLREAESLRKSISGDDLGPCSNLEAAYDKFVLFMLW